MDAVVEPSFGFRELNALRNPLASNASSSWLYAQWGWPDPKGHPWILNSSDYKGQTDPRKWMLTVNGRKVFLRGGNWVPIDQMFGRGVREQARLRAVLTLARDAGYTFLRVDGVGLVEDQSFYRMCDELGLLIEQEMPMAGCSYGPQDWPPKGNMTQLNSWREQLPIMLSQLINHPSVVRYSMANEFYLNASYSPIAAQYERITKEFDPTRIVRASDPVCIGQRHGPYTFAAIGDRDTSVGGYEVYGKGCGNFPQANCTVKPARTGGPGDPFEWTEFGMTGLSDVATLRSIMNESELMPTGKAAVWAWHKADGNPFVSWQATDFYREVFLPKDGSTDFASIEQEVKASQWLQAEGYRYAYQASRRRKWHRSAMVAWAYNEPWPNAVHQSIVDYRGRSKHAYHWVKASLGMLDVSLEYYALTVAADGTTPIGVALWVDSEHDAPIAACCVRLETWHTKHGRGPSETHTIQGGQILPAQATRVASVGITMWSGEEGGVLLARASLLAADGKTALAQHTYTFAPVAPQKMAVVDAPLAPLLHAPPTTLALTAQRKPTGAIAMRVSTDGAKDTAAILVELSLRDADGRRLPYVSISRNFVTMLCGESVEAVAEVLWDGKLVHNAALGGAVSLAGVSACAEAWNAKRMCMTLDDMGGRAGGCRRRRSLILRPALPSAATPSFSPNSARCFGIVWRLITTPRPRISLGLTGRSPILGRTT